MNKIVVLDAGHGGKDAGAVNGTRYEKNDVLKLSLEVEKLLKKQSGITVHLTRSKDEYVELYSRSVFSNNLKADVFVSIHRNAHTNSSGNGTENWVHPQAPPTDTVLATEILDRLVAVGVGTNRGIKKGDYSVLRNTKAPAVMIELGFITNASDNNLFDSNFNGYAKAIAQGICAYLGIDYNGETPKQYARIQTGAYTYPDNEAGARKALAEIKEVGKKYGIPELEQAFLVIPSNERVEKE